MTDSETSSLYDLDTGEGADHEALGSPLSLPSIRVTFESRFRQPQGNAEANPVKLLIYQDGLNSQSEEIRYGLRQAKYERNALQREYTSRRDIRRCGEANYKCKNLLCSVCSQSRASQQRRELREALKYQTGTILIWTATIQKRPQVSYVDARGDLLRLLQRTTSGGWMKRRGVIGTARVIESENRDLSWHVHAHTVLVFRNEVTRAEAVEFAVALRDRYLMKAHDIGVTAQKKGQSVLMGSKEGSIRYVTKDVTRLDGRNTSSKLWERVSVGDAGALELIHELERGSFRKRQWTVTGVCKLKQVEDFDDLIAELGLENLVVRP